MALSFDSGNPRLVLGSISELSGASQMSIATWLKLDTNTVDAVIAMRGTTFEAAVPWVLWRDEAAAATARNKTLHAHLNTNAGIVSAVASDGLLDDTDQWHHVAMVFEAGQSDGMRLFVDGVRDPYYESTVGHSQLVTTSDDVTIGLDDASKWLQGDVAEFCITNDVLSDSEIAQLAAGRTPLALPNAPARLVVYQDCIRSVNRPGIGPVASTAGTINPAPHPRVLPLCRNPIYVSDIHSTIAGPHHQAASAIRSSHCEPGTLFVTGTSGATPTGEVHS
ncbi:LamG domain-containing protein [Aeoliella sp.]|uniref:LamG domain-containing protein n=1 Tax=Aeoliella sp. TaxID=2795800 RepID=UPI003CCBA34A